MVHNSEDIEHQLFTECKRLMEASGIFRTTTCKQGRQNIFLWKWTSEWKTAMGAVRFELYMCPMQRRFQCDCQLKICHAPDYFSLEIRGMQDVNSHAPDKDTGPNFLKVAQIDVIQQGVRNAHCTDADCQAASAQS